MEFLKKISKGMLREGTLLGTGLLCVLLWKRRYIPDYIVTLSVAFTAISLFNLVLDILKRKGGKRPSRSSSAVECEEECGENLEMQPGSEELLSGRISTGVKADRDVNKGNELIEGAGTTVGMSEKQEEKAGGAGTTVGMSEKQEEKAGGAGTTVGMSEKQEETAGGAGMTVGIGEKQEEKAGGADPTAGCSDKGEVVIPVTSQGQLKDSELEHSVKFVNTLGIDPNEMKELKDILIEEFKRLHETRHNYSTSHETGDDEQSKFIQLSEAESSVYHASQHFKQYENLPSGTDESDVKPK